MQHNVIQSTHLHLSNYFPSWLQLWNPQDQRQNHQCIRFHHVSTTMLANFFCTCSCTFTQVIKEQSMTWGVISPVWESSGFPTMMEKCEILYSWSPNIYECSWRYSVCVMSWYCSPDFCAWNRSIFSIPIDSICMTVLEVDMLFQSYGGVLKTEFFWRFGFWIHSVYSINLPFLF